MPTPERMGDTWDYLRMSTDDQEDSPVTQDNHIEAFIQQRGLNWTRTYFDLGVSSGLALNQRHGMAALLTDAEKFRPACIVFYKLDRAFRDSYEQAGALKHLKKLGVKVLKVRDPNIDGPQGDLVDTVLGAVNQFERQLTGLRIRDHNHTMAQRGEWTGGSPPYGYTYRKPIKETRNRKAMTITPGAVEPHPVEWPIARQIWDWALSGCRKAQILQRTVDAGYRKRNGNHWRFADLDRLFDSRVYAGFVPFGHNVSGKTSHKGGGPGEWYHGQHPAMVTEDEWHRVQVMLRQGNLRQRSVRNPRMELAGLISCGICGAPASASAGNRNGHFSYSCTSAATYAGKHDYWCRRDWIIHLLLQLVLDEAVAQLPATPPTVQVNAHRKTIENEIGQLERQLKRLKELYVLGEYGDDLPAYQQRKSYLEAQLHVKRSELTHVGAPADQLKKLHKDLAEWSGAYAAAEGNVHARQRIWRSFIERVTVGRTALHVRLVELGPGIPRDWEVPLPPPRTRQPGSAHQGGVVGNPKGRTTSAWHWPRPRPTAEVTADA